MVIKEWCESMNDEQILAALRAFSAQRQAEIEEKGVSRWEEHILKEVLEASGLTNDRASAILVAVQLIIKGEKLRDGV